MKQRIKFKKQHKAYPEYKYSGVEWLGEIPEKWNIAKLKTMAKLNPGQSPDALSVNSDADGLPFFQGKTEFGSLYPEIAYYCNKPRKKAAKWDVLISVRAPVGDLNIANQECAIGRGLAAIKFENHKYGYYLLKSAYAELNTYSTGSTFEAITTGDIGQIFVPINGQKTQNSIASYLDQKTALLDQIIEKKNKLIELLKEKRAAVINRAVTKGLDPEVEMVNSGVDWIGKVPKGWRVRRLKMVSLVKRGASPRPIDDAKYFDDDGAYSWVRIADVTRSEKYLEQTPQKLSFLGQTLSVPLQPGELFVSIAGSVGKPMITKIKCCIHDGFVYFRNLMLSREFLFYIFYGGEPYKGLGKLGTQLNLNTDTIGNISIPIPSRQEQDKIVDYINEKERKSLEAIEKIQNSICLILEYKTSLISHVVTGKVNIGG